MNIFIDINPLKQKNISGVGKYLYELLSSLFILDHNNQYFLFSYGWRNKNIIINLPKASNVHYIHYHFPGKFIFLLGFLNLFKIDYLRIDGNLFAGFLNKNSEKSVQADLVWLPNLGISSLKSKKTKLITTIHDLSFKIYPQFFNFTRTLWHFLVDPQALVKKSNKLIAVSENTACDLQNIYKIAKDKIVVMNLGVSRRYRILNSAELEIVKSKYNLNKNFILFLGTKEPRKNILSILQAFVKLKSSDLELIIIGGSGWGNKKNYLDFYEKLPENLKSKIKIIEYCPEDDLPALYNLAKIFVWPSFYEGFGLPVLEAMACGCPVITANNSSLPAIVKDKALLVEAFNVNSLFLAIKNLLADRRLYNFYKNQKFDEAYYSNWSKSASRILKLFNQDQK